VTQGIVGAHFKNRTPTKQCFCTFSSMLWFGTPVLQIRAQFRKKHIE